MIITTVIEKKSLKGGNEKDFKNIKMLLAWFLKRYCLYVLAVSFSKINQVSFVAIISFSFITVIAVIITIVCFILILFHFILKLFFIVSY